MSSTQHTPSQSTDQEPLPDQPQPSSGPSGADFFLSDATSQHPLDLSLPSHRADTRSPSMRPVDRRSVSAILLEVKMEISEDFPMEEEPQEPQVHPSHLDAFLVPPSSNNSLTVNPPTVGARTYNTTPAPVQYEDGDYSFGGNSSRGPTSSTQYYQQNSQGGHNPFTAQRGASPSRRIYRSVFFFSFRVFFFVSD